MIKVVITGGPCGGKKMLIEKLKEKFGSKIIITPDVYKILKEKYKNKTISADMFENEAIEKQYDIEKEAKKKALKQGIKIIIFYRGLLDYALYFKNFYKKYKTNQEEIYKYYDYIFHLESLSTINPISYEKTRQNDKTLPNLETAQEIEFATRKVWSKHKGLQYFPKNINKAIENILNKIENFLKKNN